jgi:quercetin dioxygenase-like cupin family protein
MITILNSKYCKKLIFIFHKQKHPAQYHKIKQETFFILYGKVKLEIIRNKKKTVKNLKEGDLITLYPGDIHSFSGLSKDGAVIEELSTKSSSADSFYLDTSINKNKNRKSFISLN